MTESGSRHGAWHRAVRMRTLARNRRRRARENLMGKTSARPAPVRLPARPEGGAPSGSAPPPQCCCVVCSPAANGRLLYIPRSVAELKPVRGTTITYDQPELSDGSVSDRSAPVVLPLTW